MSPRWQASEVRHCAAMVSARGEMVRFSQPVMVLLCPLMVQVDQCQPACDWIYANP